MKVLDDFFLGGASANADPVFEVRTQAFDQPNAVGTGSLPADCPGGPSEAVLLGSLTTYRVAETLMATFGAAIEIKGGRRRWSRQE